MKDLQNKLLKFNAITNEDKIYTRITQPIPPEYDDTNKLDNLNPDIIKCLNNSGITKLYKHQAESIQKAMDNNNVVLQSPTASGKTLSFTLPMLEKLYKNKNASALMIYPMKALANDQRKQLQKLDIKKCLKIESWTFDGDTPHEYKKQIKLSPPQILITNPEMLHLSFLQVPDTWDKFYKNLKYIVIDEMHVYRGFFGTNFSFIIKRFLHMLALRGIYPKLFLATATCANPLEHAHNLTGQKFKLVSAQNKIAPRRNFFFVDTPLKYDNKKIFNEFLHKISNAGLASMSLKKSTLVFCYSRKMVDEAYKYAIKNAREYGLNADEIAPYRAGLKADERFDIESKLKSNEIKLVFTTNALELGIDIGQLDTVILAGFPESVLSAWQRIGRAGRSWNKSANIIFYALPNAIDIFYVNNVDSFINKPFDELSIGIDNKELIKKHLPYLLYESNRKTVLYDMLGESFKKEALTIINTTNPLRNNQRPYYGNLNIRSNSLMSYKLICNNEEIATMSDLNVFKEAYIGAIYTHINHKYDVISIGANEINLKRNNGNKITIPTFHTNITQKNIFNGCKYGEKFEIFYGTINNSVVFDNYKIVDEDNHNSIYEHIECNNSKTISADSFWINLNDQNLSPDILRAVENIFRIGINFVIPSDRYDISTYSESTHNTIYIYENFSGGIGLSKSIFIKWKEILTKGIEITKNCDCLDGCPKCIMPTIAYKSNNSLDKSNGIKYANKLLDPTNIITNKFDAINHAWSIL